MLVFKYLLILPIFLYGSECWAITKEDACRINALHQSIQRYASRHQVVSLHLQQWSSTPDHPTSTHGNYPGTASNPIRAYRL